MRNLVLAFLSRDWAGLVLAGIVAFAGWALARPWPDAPSWLLWPGCILIAASVPMAAGAVVHLGLMARARAKFPPPGTLVDVGGYRMHLLAEGEAKGNPTIVWFTGGHSGGFALYHLHRALRERTRSILVDRPGCGWSDIGPFPQRTAKEAEDVIRALERTGEAGPFIFAGHSFGGLLAANIARRRPDLTAHVVLLDATPPDTVFYGPRLANFRQMRTAPAVAALLRLFGFHQDAAETKLRRNPEYDKVMKAVEACLGHDADGMRAIEKGSRFGCVAASIYEEFSPEYFGRVAWETCVYDGDLEGLSVLLVAPGAMRDEEFKSLPLADGPLGEGDAGAREAARMTRFYALTRERYMATSSRSRRIYAPEGSGHNFPYEHPDFVIGVFNDLLKA